jgi:preprotein translocase subunit SecA
LLLGSVDDVESELCSLLGIELPSREEMGSEPSSQAARTDGISSKLQVPPRKDGLDDRTSLSSSRPIVGEEPISSRDGSRGADASTETNLHTRMIEKKIKEFGRDNFLNAARVVLLQVIDMYWVEHLEVMDYTRGSVNLRAYGQRDPLIEYKKEGLRLFREMQGAMKGQIIRILPNIVPMIGGKPVPTNNDIDMSEVRENAKMIGEQDGSKDAHLIAKKAEPGRNDPCPCGSGKKYKKCHGLQR